MAIELRPGSPDDLAAIVRIYNHYVETTAVSFDVEPVRAEDRLDWLAEHSAGGPYRLLVAVEGRSEPLGWASSSPYRTRPAYRTTVEVSVYCRPDAVGRGVGSALYAQLFAELGRFDLERIVAGVTLPNPASVALHRRFGFRPVGVFTRVGRKFGRYWDVAWFERPTHGALEAVGPESSPAAGTTGDPDGPTAQGPAPGSAHPVPG